MPTETALRPIQGRERRATLNALKTWIDARGNDGIPDLAGLTGKADPTEERAFFTENQFLIMLETYSVDTVVIFYGSELPNMPVRRVVGNSLQRTLPAALRGLFQDACLEAVNGRDVVYRQGAINTPTGAGVLCRGIFMPLRSGSHPDRSYVFGAFSNQDGGAELLAAA